MDSIYNSSEESELSTPLYQFETSSNPQFPIDNTSTQKQINYTTSNYLSRLLFSWSTLAMKLSNKGILKIKDVSPLSPEQKTLHHIVPLESSWRKFSSNKNHTFPLIYSIFSVHLYEILFLFLFDFSLMAADYVNMFFYRQVLLHFSLGDFDGKDNKFRFTLVQSVIFLILVRIYKTIAFQHQDFRNVMLSERISNEITALIYGKILKGNTNSNLRAKEEGEKLNLVEVDVEKIGFVFFIGPKILTAPFRIALNVYLLFKLYRFNFIYSFVILCGGMAIVMTLQYFFLRNFQIELGKKDDRLKIVTDTFSTLKSIKLNGWDNLFFERIREKREDELKYYSRNQSIHVCRQSINANVPLIMLIVSIGMEVFSDRRIETSNLFTAMQLVNELRIPLLFIPLHITQFLENLICINRIQKFLNSPEHDYSTHHNDVLKQRDIIVKFDNTSFGVHSVATSLNYSIIEEKTNLNSKNISTSEKVTLLNDITLEIKKGEFIGIVGATGSGKSNLLNAILNNFEVFSSSSPIVINGKISYSSQQPWVMNDTIKNNILFYNKYDENRYNETISCCQLEKDIDNFPHGDNSEISTSGSNVSGGQRARISLARCLYKDADIYLLDDPLASIDTKVAHCIFKEAFCGFISGKTIVLATNELPNLSLLDKIVLMEEGRIKYIGSYKEFDSIYGKELRVNNEILKSVSNKNLLEFEEKKKEWSEEDYSSSNGKNEIAKKIGLISVKKKDKVNKRNLTLEEKSSKGGISLKVYNTYIKITGGYLMFFFSIMIIIAMNISIMWRDMFLASWSKSLKELNKEKEEDSIQMKINNEESRNNFFVYVKLSLIGMGLQFATDFIVSRIQTSSVRELHELMISKLIKAPINLFHDIVPIGQILNRVTKDLALVHRLILTMTMFFRHNFGLFSSIYICYKYNYSTLLFGPILLIVGLLLTKYFISAARDLQRYHRSTFSPVITIITETIRGVETIRSGEAGNNMKLKIYKRLDDHYGVHLYIEGSDKWYRIFLNVTSHLFFGMIIIYIVYYKELFTAQALGLILQYTATFNEQLVGMMRAYSEIECSMVCLERCDAYTRIPGEKDIGQIEEFPEEKVGGKKQRWPFKGEIKFKNYSSRYRENTPIVLNKINLVTQPGEKLGIVGRTGSGKSSLVLGLCRIIEPVNGKIEIDNVDISKVRLETLRQSLTVVPQEPFLLEGTLRENIDPLNIRSDSEIVKILDDFCLFMHVKNTKERLEIKIQSNASNLSTGERQLICFARAVIKKSKVVILDEATANIDVQTEKIIKKNMNTYFADATVIIIAHHIQMVSGCERIAVINNGEIVECDSYKTLLKNKKSKFYEFYAESL